MENEPLVAALVDESVIAWLSGLYGDPDRRYHGLGHVETLLALARDFRAVLADPAAVEAAIWFHDAIYDSRRKDNEKLSAELAAGKLAGRAAPDRLARIVAMIEATATHVVPDLETAAATHDAALFLDMDLSILGAEDAVFDAYEAAVRHEYGWVEEAPWRAGRAAVLNGFLARPHIFHTDELRSRFERQARANMARSLAALQASG